VFPSGVQQKRSEGVVPQGVLGRDVPRGFPVLVLWGVPKVGSTGWVPNRGSPGGSFLGGFQWRIPSVITPGFLPREGTQVWSQTGSQQRVPAWGSPGGLPHGIFQCGSASRGPHWWFTRGLPQGSKPGGITHFGSQGGPHWVHSSCSRGVSPRCGP
jgi:hypothetical protein